MSKALYALLKLYLGTIACFCTSTLFAKASLAQVTSDGTVNTQVNSNGNVSEITGGATRGNNLFHSFQDFSVPTDNEAAFNNADSISNIFSRVTGGNISNIDGTISANGSASLFLINPAGIIFGNNARLDIGGSFYGSSASSILFEDGEFSAVDNLQQPILTVNAPIGLGFRDEPGDIVNRSFTENSAEEFVGLEVEQGNSLALIGGDINFEAGEATAMGGNIYLGGLAEAGRISLNEDGSLNFPENIIIADINLTNNADVDVRGTGGGNITVNARNLALEAGEFGSSLIQAGITSDSTSSPAQAGDITIDTENISLNDSRIINQVSFGGAGNSGNINITTNSIEAINGGDIDATTFGQGNGGNINITATEDLSFDGERASGFAGGVTSVVNSDAVGNAGNVTISTDNLTLTNGGRVAADTFSQGNGGNINITATGDLSFDGEDLDSLASGVTSVVNSDAVGNAGDVTISTNNFALTNGGRVAADTFSQGNGGDINITATGDLSLDGSLNNSVSNNSKVTSLVEEDAVGNGGNITISTNNLTSINSADIETSTSNQGNAGNINIIATGDLTFDSNGDIRSSVNSDGVGNAGNINISSNNLTLTDGASISAGNTGLGDSGNVSITAKESVLIDGAESPQTFITTNSFVSSDFPDFVSKNLGKLEINASKITVTNNALVSTSSSQGISGNLVIRASESFKVTNNAVIHAEVSRRSIEANSSLLETNGNLIIETANLTVANGGQISASIFGSGSAGDLTILATDSVLITGETGSGSSALLAIAVEENGKGGELNIFTQDLTVSDNAIVSVGNFPTIEGLRDQGTGEPGNLNIQADSINVESDGRITAATQSSLGGANINLNVADNITLKDDGLISAQARNEGNGGNLNIDTNFIVAFDGDNDIVASAEQGQGGNINISAEALLGIEERPLNEATNDINASSEFSLDGTVAISNPDINPVRGAAQLPTNIVVPEETSQQACRANRAVAANSGLNITGKGGISPAPDLPLNSLNVAVSGEDNSTSTIPAPIKTAKGKVQPARGIKISKTGEIVLTAYRTNNAGERLPEIKRNCDRL